MIGFLFGLLILIGAFYFLAFLFEFAVILFLGLCGIALWSQGIVGQAIVVVFGLLYIFRK